MDYAQKLARRKEYHARKYAAQKSERDAIRAFKEQNPERFAELLRKVQAEQQAAIVAAMQSTANAWEQTKSAEAEDRIYELVKQIHAGKRDWLIQAKDTYGDTHTLFLGFPREHTPQPGDKIKTPIKQEEYTILEASPCTCPLCT